MPPFDLCTISDDNAHSHDSFQNANIHNSKPKIPNRTVCLFFSYAPSHLGGISLLQESEYQFARRRSNFSPFSPNILYTRLLCMYIYIFTRRRSLFSSHPPRTYLRVRPLLWDPTARRVYAPILWW